MVDQVNNDFSSGIPKLSSPIIERIDPNSPWSGSNITIKISMSLWQRREEINEKGHKLPHSVATDDCTLLQDWQVAIKNLYLLLGN